ncbi:MAG TPA: glycosyltransferase family 87 protein [Thermoanaerobaculaceae bacterium]|nr:glycosyltransferase family 87 protein [Thermoanaerobaculaceae bacterium]
MATGAGAGRSADVEPGGSSGWQPGAAAAGLGAAACAAVYLARNLVLALPYLRGGPSDFTNYYLAARALLAGRSPFSAPNFDYPALLALLVAPVAWLPEPAARLAWFGLGHACLLAAALLAWRRLGGDRAALVAVAAVWGLGGTIAENLVLGQVNPLLLLLLVGAGSRGWAGRPRGGAVLGVATALKLWPAVALLKDALARRWRAVAAGVLVGGALLAVPWAAVALLLPPPHTPPRAGYWMGTPALLNASVPAVALRLLDPPTAGRPLPRHWVFGNDPGQTALPSAGAAAGVAAAAAVLAAGVLLLRRRAAAAGAADEDEPAALAALVALALLAAPISWYHYQLLNFPGIALLASRWLRARRRAALAGLAAILVAATWSHVLFVGAYVAHFGWTAAAPIRLWLATLATPAAGAGLFALLRRELGRSGAGGSAVLS